MVPSPAPPYQERQPEGAQAIEDSSPMASPGRESLAVKRATELAFDSAPTEPAPLPCPHPLPSYWTQTSAEPGPAQGVFTPQDGVDIEPEVDVAIIGAGITGISAAYHLANRLTPRYDGQPIKVVVLEARDFCSGATGRNGGHLTPLSVLSYDELASNPAHLSRFLSSTSREEHWGNDRGTKTDEVIRKILTLEARTSAEILMIVRMAAARAKKQKMLRQKQGAVTSDEIQEGDSLDVELVSGSNWHLCQSSEEEAAFDASIERAKRAGLSDLAMQVKKVPSEEWHKRLHDPRKITAVYEIPGSTVHSRRLVLLLHQLAYANAQRSKTDLKVFTQTPVLAVKSLSGGASSLETPRGNVRARYVIHATNAYASHLLPQYAGPKGIVPTRAQCVSVLPSKSPSEGEPLWQMGFSLNHGFEYLQQRPNRSTDGAVQPCILGGGRWAAIDREWGVADDTKTNPDVSAVLRPMLSDLFPNNFSKGDPVELEWTGIIGHSKSGDPFVGPVVASAPASHGASAVDASPHPTSSSPTEIVPGQYIVAGYSGHGMTRAYSCAEVVVDMIVADRAGEEWVPPVWFPLSYLTAMPRRMVGGEGNSVPQSNGGNFNQHNASQSAAGLPSTSTTTATGTYHLFSAGSNSGGQLGTGSQEDSHIWSPALYQPADSSSFDAKNEKQEALSFPPAGSRVHQLAGGANHTLALVLDESSGERFVWRSGDGERGQWGAPEPEGGAREEKKEGRGTATLFTPLPVPAGLLESNLKPRLVAASWENSYIVYSPHSSGSDQERGDDVLVVLGRENDFGQTGLGKTEGKAAPGVGVISLSGAVPDDEDGGSARGRGRGRGRLEIVHLVGSVRHVVLVASWLSSCGSNTHRRRYALIGWGAGRQGQLGSLDAQGTTQGRSTGSGAPAGAGAGNIIWTPRLIRLWSSEQLDIDTQASLSLGRDHTALLVPSHWRSESSRNEDGEDQGESRLLLLGSNKYGQLAISASIGPGAQSEVRNAISIACTWNSTLLFLADGSLLASGRNDKGQLGGEPQQQQQRSLAPAQLVRVPAVDAGSYGGASALKQALVCGSEHALLLVQSSSSSSSSLLQGSPSTEVGRESSVWGWGWNEHGNLALGGRRFVSEGNGEEEEAVEDQRTPVRIWPARAALEAAGDSIPAVHEVATDVSAGCATSFVQVLRTRTQRQR